MRGLVFTEFLEFVEEQAGPEMVETMLDACDLQSEGIYTSVGTYDHDELIAMLVFLNNATGQEVGAMVQAFGEHLFGRLATHHAAIVSDAKALLDFLEGIESHIHREVRKLYPDAELPVFDTERPDENRLIMNYRSARPFADLAHGMIRGAARHFGTKVTVHRSEVANADGTAARFEVIAA